MRHEGSTEAIESFAPWRETFATPGMGMGMGMVVDGWVGGCVCEGGDRDQYLSYPSPNIRFLLVFNGFIDVHLDFLLKVKGNHQK